MADQYDNEWQVFFDQYIKYASDPPEKWTSLTLLSYFLVRYKEVNGVEYIYTPTKKGPTKTKEMKDAAKIYSAFDKGRYKQLTDKNDKLVYKQQLVDVLKQYIDWAFMVKMRGKQSITGLGLFTNARFMNEFLQWRKKNQKAIPLRSQTLPDSFIEWIRHNAGEIWDKQQLNVMEDLNQLYNYVEAYDTDHKSVEFVVLEKARELGIMPKTGKLELDKK